ESTSPVPKSSTIFESSEAPVANPDDWVKLAATWQPSSQTWGPLAESWKQSARPANADVPPEKPVATTLPVSDGQQSSLNHTSRHDEPQQTGTLTSPAEPSSKPKSPPSVNYQDSQESPWWLWPVVVFNSGFDHVLSLFGPLGDWLRGRTGR